MPTHLSRLLLLPALLALAAAAELPAQSRTAAPVPPQEAGFSGVGRAGSRMVALPGGLGTIELPSGFEEFPLSDRHRRRALSDGPGELIGYATASGDGLILLTAHPGVRFSIAAAKFKTSLEAFFRRRHPDAQWITSEVLPIDGVEWVHMEVRERTPEGSLHIHSLHAIAFGQLVTVVYVIPEATYPRHRDEIMASIRTLRLEPSNPGEGTFLAATIGGRPLLLPWQTDSE